MVRLTLLPRHCLNLTASVRIGSQTYVRFKENENQDISLSTVKIEQKLIQYVHLFFVINSPFFLVALNVIS